MKDLVPYGKQKKHAQVVTVSGGKGGVGKTFFSVNFAAELKKMGYTVLIFDADVNLANVNILLSIDNNSRFQDFLSGDIPIKDIIQKGVGGVDVLYVGDELKHIFTIDSEQFKKIISGLHELETMYDFIIIDTQAGINDLNLKLLVYSDRIVMITNPEITALIDLYKVMKVTAGEKSGLHFDIIVNRSRNPEQAAKIYERISGTVSQFKIRAGLSFLGYIMDDPQRVFESIQKRIPIVILHHSSSVRECFRLAVHTFIRSAKLKRRVPFFYGLLER